jgi:hypothetical protein
VLKLTSRISDTVESVVVGSGTGSSDGQLLIQAIAAHASALVVGSESSGHIRAEADELEEVSAIEWKVRDALLLDDGAHGSVFRVQEGSDCRDFDLFGYLAQFKEKSTRAVCCTCNTSERAEGRNPVISARTV